MTAPVIELHPPCGRCNEIGFVIRPDSSAIVCPCMETCRTCDGQQWLFTRSAEGYRSSTRCERCGLARDRARAWNRAGIPARFRSARLTDATGLHRRVAAWARAWQPGAPGLFVWGDAEVGKTHGVVAGLAWLLTNSRNHVGRVPHVRYVDLNLLWERLKASMNGRGQSPDDHLRPYEAASVLVMDEVGTGRNTAFEVGQLNRLVCARYNAQLTTVFISNHHPEFLGELLDGVADVAGRRLLSRMREMSSPFEATGPRRRAWATDQD